MSDARGASLPILVALLFGLLSYFLFVDLFHGLFLLVLKGIQHALSILLRHLLALLLLLLLLLLLILILLVLLLLLVLLILLLLLLVLLLLLLLLVLTFTLLKDGGDNHVEVGHGEEITQWLYLNSGVAHLMDDVFLELVPRLGGIT